LNGENLSDFSIFDQCQKSDDELILTLYEYMKLKDEQISFQSIKCS